MSETQKLIARIHAMAERTGKSTSTLSGELLGSWAALSSLENGKTITLAKYERAMTMLDEMEAQAA